MVPSEIEVRTMVDLVHEYPVLTAAPDEWLNDAYRGLRVVSDEGMVLLLNGKAMFYGDVIVSYRPLGKGFVRVFAPELYVGPEDTLELVTKVGGFVVFRGSGAYVEVVDNPPVQQRAIEAKASAAMSKLGLSTVGDDF